MKHDLAFKSSGAAVLLFAGGILCLFAVLLSYFSGAGEGSGGLVILSLYMMGLIACGWIGYSVATLPKVLIRSDEKGLYLYGEKNVETFVAFENIIRVAQKNLRGRGIRYAFGKIIVYATDGKHVVNFVSDVVQVKNDIVLLIETAKNAMPKKQFSKWEDFDHEA